MVNEKITWQAAKEILSSLSKNVYQTKFSYPGNFTATYYSPDGITHLYSFIDKNNLWLQDAWGHLGYVIVGCLENEKLVNSIKSGNLKVLDALAGKIIRAANMTVEPTLIKEMIPVVIDKYFK